MANVVIIGSGPAGISAALYARRAGLDVSVIHRGPGALEKAEAIENYYGFSEPVTGIKLWENGMANAKRLGVQFFEDEVVGFAVEDTLVVLTAKGRYPADGVVIATGSPRKSPPIAALQDFEGRGVSYCAACDGFFYRGRDVAVVGAGEYALHEAMELLPLAKSVTLLTNGEKPSVQIPEEILVREEKVTSVEGDERLRAAVFASGEKIMIEGLFVAYGVAGSADLARKVGGGDRGQPHRRRRKHGHQCAGPLRRGRLHRGPSAGGQGSLRRREGGHGADQIHPEEGLTCCSEKRVAQTKTPNWSSRWSAALRTIPARPSACAPRTR